MYNYNTTRPPLILKEYGRHLQRLMEQLENVEDRSIRTQKAYAIIKLMEVINPNAESVQKRWDDLFILSNYKLDIDWPMAKSVATTARLYYVVPTLFSQPIKYKYYGRHITSLLHKVSSYSVSKEQAQMLMLIAKLMRRFSHIWNNEYISNEKLMEDIRRMLPSDTVVCLEVIRTLPNDIANGQRTKSNHFTRSVVQHARNKIQQHNNFSFINR